MNRTFRNWPRWLWMAKELLRHPEMSPACPYCSKKDVLASEVRVDLPRPLGRIVKVGTFRRRSDDVLLQRFLCHHCQRTFSEATLNPCYRQKRRDANPLIFQLLVSGVSQRRASRLLRLNRKTVVRKFIWMGLIADRVLTWDRRHFPLVNELEFDDLETFEHSKLKPLSVTMAVERHSRRILGYRVGRMPAKGHLVQRSLKKYGPRVDERKLRREELFADIQSSVNPSCLIKSDMNPHYRPSVRKYFPEANHFVTEGRRGCVVGQGELKAGGFDPLFTLNHTFAMFRANINRLFRRTWNTTKKPQRLDLHIALYVLYHNWALVPQQTKA